MLLTFASVLILAFLHRWAVHLHPSRYVEKKYWLSFADGISITYIFLQLLPEISHIASEKAHFDKPLSVQFYEPIKVLSQWGEHHPFLPLLIGFTLFYGLERWIEKPVSRSPEGKSSLAVHFWAHIVGLSFYKVLIGYLLAQISDVKEIIVFTVAMLMHFLAIDFHLVEMHRNAYQRFGRWALAGSLLIGWGSSAVIAVSPAVLAMLISFVSGAAVLMIIQDEFSEANPSSFPTFLTAVTLYSALLLLL
jgi:hypothetical protein